MGLIEINLNTTNHEVQKHITEETRKQLQLRSIQLTSSNIPTENFYKSGGVMSILQGDILTKDNVVITVVTAYQPYQPSSSTGTTTYHQQVVMSQQQKWNIDPCTAFLTDLTQWLKECRLKGEQLIIRGDFNVTLTSKSKLTKLATDAKLQLLSPEVDTTNSTK
eukprot:10652678-Ditylum_brightwellii.AAC.1